MREKYYSLVWYILITAIVRVAWYMLIVTYSETQTINSNLALSQIQIGLLPSASSKLSSPNGKVQNMDPWSMDPLHGPGPGSPIFTTPKITD